MKPNNEYLTADIANIACIACCRETEFPAFIWDGAKLVPSDPRTLARRQDLMEIEFHQY